MGRLAISRHGTLWCDAGRFSLVTFPTNQRVAATKRQIQQVLVDTGRWIAVFCPVEGSGVRVGEHVLESADYGLASLQRQFRSHVRHHGPLFQCRELCWEEMSKRNNELQADPGLRANQASPAWHAPDARTDIWAAASVTPGLFAYGCLLNDELAGYIVAWQQDDCCHGMLFHRSRHFDAQRISNILLYNFSAAVLARPGIRRINMGRSWFPQKPGLDQFKRHAGYQEQSTDLAVVLHPKLELILQSRLTHRCLRIAARISGGRFSPENDLYLFQAARQTKIA